MKEMKLRLVKNHVGQILTSAEMEKFYTNRAYEIDHNFDGPGPATIIRDDDKGSTGIKEMDADKLRCCGSFRSTPYWAIFIRTIKFAVHFLVVMLILFVSALIFAEIEDPESRTKTLVLNKCESYENSTAVMCFFWEKLEAEFNINVSEHHRDSVLTRFKQYIAEEDEQNEKIEYHQKHKDKKYVYLKWFYFATITTTPVGYGDVSPKSDYGKIFCIFFVIIGVVLMMTLLKSLGSIITSLTNKFHGLILKYLCRGKNLVSEELLSVLSILIVFLAFLFCGIFFGRTTKEVGWSVIDIVYYWIITFTTVGYGDLTMPLDIEIDFLAEQVVYRLIGLAFLAAIIDAIQVYADLRKKLLEEEKEKLKQRKKDSWGHNFSGKFVSPRKS